ncbi:aldehyde dehydrogenase family protein [Paraburkholderia bryophila]|uniref:Aldehyde dehydrogenase (NAD+) n=1 Tax=Paraburkholderia bryophila TaxID=420952 RepID=A0A7Y9WKX6_9BURK|nr:aldehyde dehydrogenase family protein [Paraburkholderia bryophila]NYH19312.1 aldehyde dehydrogenase (NAD+) [Paraburkholderia bryophila]NYH21683.1 aldehyde dehydrogenase (NAD+) [Paraburkholderia bryophila]
MQHTRQFYIDGQWVDPLDQGEANTLDVIDPSTATAFEQIALGSAADVDRAVAAAKRAFPAYSETTIAQRIDLLQAILDVYRKRYDDMVHAISREMGAPLQYANDAQAWTGVAHLETMIRTLDTFDFESMKNGILIRKEAVGVCGLITPWNWPALQITTKVAPALAAGCTMVLKPSELAPLSGLIFAEILDEAGVPAGVFNLVNGEGRTVGEAMSRHPDIDMMSFTGSTRAGVQVAKAAADTVKRVHQELGGKSANLILEDADLKQAVMRGARACFDNSGQSCDAPTRMFVPRAREAEALAYAKEAAEALKVGPASAAGTDLGPVISEVQFDKIQRLIGVGMEEGATLVAGGVGRPDGLKDGYFVRPTVFGKVTPDMTIAREEIFGPVLSILAYDSEDEAIAMANDSLYGLAGYIQSGSIEHARAVARRLRTGTIYLNYADYNPDAPFGGFKQSGNGREYGEFGLEDFLEIKGVVGYEG